MDREHAAAFVDAILDMADRLHASILEIDAQLSEEATEAYEKHAGYAIKYLFGDLLRPIFREHPDLEPDAFRSDEAAVQGTNRLNPHTIRRVTDLARDLDELAKRAEDESAPGGEDDLWTEGTAEIRNAVAMINDFINEHAR
jgi:hypothetical protein